MFWGCSNLIGGKGTKYDASHGDHTYARIDQGPDSEAPGYFTRSGDAPWVEPEAYAVLSDDNTVLTFYYDSHKAERNGMSVGPFTGHPNYSSWYADREAITTVVFDTSFAGCTTLTSTAYWFYECSNLTTISSIGNLKTDNVVGMNCMFYGCSGLTSLDLSSLNTSNVTDIWDMFYGCNGLTNLNLSGFKTDNVTDMLRMFYGCSGLTSLDLSSIKTDNVTRMTGMFYGCSGLTSLDLSSFNTSNVTDMNYVFMGCSGLTSLDLSSFNTSNVMRMNEMFEGCSGLTSLDLSSFNTSNVTDISSMFYNCSSLTSLNLSNFNTDGVTDMNRMFYGCSGLTGLALNSFNTSNVTDMTCMFSGCSGLTSLDLSSFNTSNVTSMGAMFRGCSGLTSLDLRGFKTDNVIYMGGIFEGCSALTSLDLSGFKTANMTDMSTMFSGCSGLTSLDVSGFKTDNVMDMRSMFSGCGGLATIYVGEGWNTSAVTEGGWMFSACSNLIGGKGTKYNDYHTDYTYARIDQGPDSDAPGYFTRSGDAPWVEPEAYAVLTGDSITGMTLTFYYDGQKSERNGMSVGPFYYVWDETLQTSVFNQSWYAERKAITTVVFDTSFAGCTTLTSTAYWFYECSNLSTISGIENLRTDSVTDMGSMFRGCSGLTTLDVSGFKTDNVTNMSSMFYGCSGLTSLDVSGFKTDNVTYMGSMFSGCSGLTSLDVSGFKTDNVTNMHGMFSDCSGLTSLDVSGFNTDNVTNMGFMFSGCSGLTSLDVSGFKTDNVTHMNWMFGGCSGLTSLDVSSFNTDNVTNMYEMFFGCSGLTSLDVSGFKTDNVTDMGYMFYDCSALTTIYVGEEWNTAAVTSGDYMFGSCYNLVGGNGTKYDASHVDHTYARIDQGPDSDAPGYFTRSGDAPWVEPEAYAVLSDDNTVLTFYYDGHKAERNGMSIESSYAQLWHAECEAITTVVFDASFAGYTTLTSTSHWFAGCSKLATISGIENLNTSNVTDMNYMFNACSSLTSLDLSNLNTSSVTSMHGMFDGCSSLTSLDLSSLNTENVTDMVNMFIGCSGLTSLDLSNFNTSSVTSMGAMFSGCSSLTSLDLSSFNTANVTNMGSMFFGCSGLTSLVLSGFNTENVTDMSWMFCSCSSLTNLDLSGFKTGSVTYMHGMLWNCSGLTNLNLSGLNTEEVTSIFQMFAGCSGLTSLDLSSFNTRNVVDMRCMFGGCSGLTTIYVGDGWTTANVTESLEMFIECSNLVGGNGTKYDASHVDHTYARIDQGPDSDAPGYFTRSGDAPWVEPEAYAVLSDDNTVLTFYYDGHKAERNGMSVVPFLGASEMEWNDNCKDITSVVFDSSFANDSTLTSTAYWFWGCSNLTTISGMENLKTDNVTDMGSMFSLCSGLTNLDVSGFNTANVTDMSNMFNGCSSLTSLDLSNFNTGNVTDMGAMFGSCSSLTNLDLSNFNTSNVTEMSEMFAGCDGLTNLDLSSFNTENAKAIRWMFQNCSSLTNLDLSNFNTENVTGIVGMFDGCRGLTSLDVSNFNTSNVSDMSFMFYGCSALKTIYVGEGWNTSAVTEGNGMFTSCSHLVGGNGTKYDEAHIDYTYARIDQGPDSDAPGYFTRSGDIPWGEKSTFDGRVLTVRGSGSIDQALAQVGGFEQVDKTITAIVWESAVPYSGTAAFSNPNLLFYANDATKGQGISNLVYNGVAESITLTDEGEGNTDFYCPQSFTARSITYKRTFRQQTEIGVSRGWETIALPFTVQRISRVRSDEGLDRITPFGSSESDRHFWLRRLTANGLQSVQTIEANTPYIIAMPNSEEYVAEYNLAGDIVFTAENATVAVTEPVSDRSADYELTANFERMAAQDSIYVLNVGDARQGYPEGSLFEANYRDLQPFRAYTRHINNSGHPAPPYFALGELGGNSTTGISSVGNDASTSDVWYDLQGRKLQGRPTQRGVYIHNGRKVIVK